MTRQPRAIILSGLSGAGKNTALRAFEDAGLRVFDALPSTVIAESAKEILAEGPVAIVVDIRSGDPAAAETALVAAAASVSAPLTRIFLEAADETLLRRYAESRRPHPLAEAQPSVEAAIAAERAALAPFRSRADAVIATDELEPRKLASRLLEVAGGASTAVRAALHLVSFGFKHGLPPEAEWVFDVRALPNPHYDPRLRPRNGTDPEVAQVVFASPRAERLVAALHTTIDAALEAASADGRRAVTVAIGCTGGFHRSVAVVEALAAQYADDPTVEAVRVHHRDLARH